MSELTIVIKQFIKNQAHNNNNQKLEFVLSKY